MELGALLISQSDCQLYRSLCSINTSIFRCKPTLLEALTRIQLDLLHSTYTKAFHLGIFIPKPGRQWRAKPGRIVSVGLAQLLSQALDPIFSDHSHGFLKGKGSRSSLTTWPEMDYLIQCDVVKCFDRIMIDSFVT